MQFSPFTRRQFLSASAATAFASLVPNISLASNPTGKKLHGLSAFGDLKYPTDYTHFDDAVLDAPKGGTFAFTPSTTVFNQSGQTFNTLNTFTLKGDAPPRMEYCYDALMVVSPDEPDSLYCALAESVEISGDRNTYTFVLRPQAKFHDGSFVTAKDVAFSYNILKKEGHPSLSQILRNLDEASIVDDQTVELRYNGKQTDRAILSAMSVPVLSEKYHANNPIDASTLDMPLTSGQYRVKRLSTGKFIEYERVKNYWAKDMPFAVGFNHFDVLRIEFHRDQQAAFQAFKKGDICWREENISRVWKTEYNFPAVEDGRVKKKLFAGEPNPSFQNWAINARRKKFQDVKTREAIGLCFDFEWTNRTLFFDAYNRSASIFETSEFKASGRPDGEELAILEPYRDQLPEAVFKEAFEPNATNGSGNNRNALRKALKLLKEAGWQKKDGVLKNPNGEILEIEFLIGSPSFERVLGNFVDNLKRIGAKPSIRLVDPSQYQARVEEFDFDIIVLGLNLSPTPTAETLRILLHSESADISGSYNLPSVKSPVIDGLLDRLKGVSSRAELIPILKSIDRVLRPMHLWIPNLLGYVWLERTKASIFLFHRNLLVV